MFLYRLNIIADIFFFQCTSPTNMKQCCLGICPPLDFFINLCKLFLFFLLIRNKYSLIEQKMLC